MKKAILVLLVLLVGVICVANPLWDFELETGHEWRQWTGTQKQMFLYGYIDTIFTLAQFADAQELHLIRDWITIVGLGAYDLVTVRDFLDIYYRVPENRSHPVLWVILMEMQERVEHY